MKSVLFLILLLIALPAFGETQAPAASPTPRPAPEAGARGSVEFWQNELKGKTKKQVKSEMGTPSSIKDKGAVYVYPDEFFHPDLDEWRDLLIRFSEIDDFAESFTGAGGDTKTYLIEAPMADEVAPPTPSPTAAESNLGELKDSVEKSVVTIEYSDHTGQRQGAGATGVLIMYKGIKYVATNLHVLEGEAEHQIQLAWHHGTRPGIANNPRLVQSARVRSTFDRFLRAIVDLPLPSIRTLDGKSVALSPDLLLSTSRDIVLIPVTTDTEALEISDSPPVRGNGCVIVGNPEAAHTLRVLDGEISQLGPDRIEVDRLRKGELQPGMSGSPVVDAKSSRVLGIVSYLTTRRSWTGDKAVQGGVGEEIMSTFETKIRNFAYRLDNIDDLISFKWSSFVRDCLMFIALKERTMNVFWASRVYSVVHGQGEQLKLTPDFDNSVSILYDSFLNDLKQTQNSRDRSRILSMWQSYQRRLELSLQSDLNNPDYQVTSPWFRDLVSTQVSSERRAVAAELRKQAGYVQSQNASR